MTAGPRPFRQFVVKVHSRCDLACDHCYVYRHADQSWRGRPVTMPDDVLRATTRRIAEHARAHALPRVHVVLHGGEPLLAGRERLRGFARDLRRELAGTAPGCGLDLRMQTNGLQLDEAMCAMLAEESIVTGVSLDGDRAANDLHRIRSDGSGSYDDVVRAVRLLGSPPYRAAFGGLLCTIDVTSDPAAVYRALADLDPPRIEFLLPHATWDRPPPRPYGGTDYADWLIAVHRLWTADGRRIPVRLFDSITRLSAGGPSLTEALGLGSPDLVVVETDGAVEQADWLKIVAPGAAKTGCHVLTDSFDKAAGHSGIAARRAGLDALSAECRACPVVRVCGGGLYGHRYRTGSGYDNPSVFTNDLLTLIRHVQEADIGDMHGLTAEQFDGLATGHGTAAAVRQLAEAQLSRRHELVPETRAAVPAPHEAWEAIYALKPAALDGLLADPYLRVWMVGGKAAADPGRPAEIALATAVRAGERLRLPVPLREGTVHLPGLGRLVTGGAEGTVVLAAQDGELLLDGQPVTRGAPLPGAVWQPLRHLEADRMRVALDDIDPYRDCYGPAALPRLDDDEAAAWQQLFRDAWRIVRTEHPGYAEGLAAGLRAVTPLAAAGGSLTSSTSVHAFGAVGIALPDTADALALVLVHEFQHTKLAALQDMYGFLSGDLSELIQVRWRPDPRPYGAALQGAYAHLAVAEVWRARTGRDPEAAGQAEYWAEGVRDAVDRLESSGALTALGERLVAGIRRGLAAG